MSQPLDVNSRTSLDFGGNSEQSKLDERNWSGDEFRQIVESAPDAMVIINDHGQIALVNVQTERLFGYDRDELLGQPVEILMPDRFRCRHREHLVDYFVNPCARSLDTDLEIYGQRKDGTEFPVEISLSPIETSGGLLISSAIRDISERKLMRAIDEARMLAEAIVETVREPLLILDTELRVQTANRSFYQTFGSTHQETENRLVYELGNGQWDIPRLRHLLEQVLPEHSQFNDFEVQHFFEGLGQRTMLLNARALNLEGDHPGLILLAIEDVTDRKLMRAINEARILAEAIVETVREPLLILDTELRVQTANRSFYKTFQITREETENQLLYELGNRQWDIPPLRRRLEQVLPEQSQFNDFEVQHSFERIGQRMMLLNARRLDREGERPGLILLAMEDITDREQLEARLRETNHNLEQQIQQVKSTLPKLDRLAAIVESSDDAIIGKTIDGTITSWNRGAERLYGYSADEIIGRPIARLAPDHPNEVASILELLKRGEGVDRLETLRVRKDGTLVDVSLTISPIVAADGKICGASTIARDITSRKRADQELKRSAAKLQQYNRELERSNRELQDFAYVVSHDLRAPLVNIQGFSKELALSCERLPSVLADLQMPEAKRRKLSALLEEDIPEALEFITTNATKMDGLLAGVLRLSRVGQAALTFGPLDINKMLSDIVASRQFAIEQSGASVQVDSLPSCLGDEIQINQVFSNLLDNALKYLDPNRLGAIRVCGQEEPDQVVYSIEDNGIGIAAQHQDSIYKVFHRLDPKRGTGEGLGLAIVRRILDRHHGKIWMESKVNEGSKFYLSLPKG